MAAGSFQPIKPFSPAIYERGTIAVAEKASQTFAKGEILKVTAGFTEIAGATPASIAYVAAEAGHNAGTDGAKLILVWPIVAGDFWEITAEDAAAATDPKSVWGLVRDATSKTWFADSADAGDQVTFQRNLGELIPGEVGAVDDTKFRALFSFVPAKIQGE